MPALSAVSLFSTLNYEQSLFPSLVHRASKKKKKSAGKINWRRAKTGSERRAFFARRRRLIFPISFPELPELRDGLSWERGTARSIFLHLIHVPSFSDLFNPQVPHSLQSRSTTDHEQA